MTQQADQTQVVNEQIATQITRALNNADATIERLRGYETAEAAKRHEQIDRSILNYAFSSYIATVLDDMTDYRIAITPLDNEVLVTGTPRSKGKKLKSFEQNVSYPEWLAVYFENEQHFGYLFPDNKTALSDILDEMEAWLDQMYPVLDEAEPETCEHGEEVDEADAEEQVLGDYIVTDSGPANGVHVGGDNDWDDEDSDEDSDEESDD